MRVQDGLSNLMIDGWFIAKLLEILPAIGVQIGMGTLR